MREKGCCAEQLFVTIGESPFEFYLTACAEHCLHSRPLGGLVDCRKTPLLDPATIGVTRAEPPTAT
ncbi:hypothetical protein MPLDJ20_260020 [Mesorhizobium plurifarium]|uniref:Uncharacterized protein n=1 Tax=Mesorhizobium plurifarium TaxID=69974 RepID=A0A090GMT2_MESPL|nr:hypothetical protein MPLDJ20_260020 [Mesorhizobium plurifarium]